MNIDDVEQAIIKGLAFLNEQQLANGEFVCYVSNNEQLSQYNFGERGWFRKDSAVFPTILIGNSLLFLKDRPYANNILLKVADFLLAQQNDGVWSHYTKGHPLHNIAPFDADDTACACAFLKRMNIHLPDIAILLLSNRNHKRLFYTWFSLRFNLNLNLRYLRLAISELKHPIKSFYFWKNFSCERDDVDAVVNANVLYYLGKSTAVMPVINYLIKVITEGREEYCDKWYKNPFTIYYFISRNYQSEIDDFESIKPIIEERIRANIKHDGSYGNSILDTALSVCTLVNFKVDVRKESVDFLLKAQSSDGSWKRRIFYYSGPQKTVGWGSEELTTAVCLEALSRYRP
jgi:hypothetical protein